MRAGSPVLSAGRRSRSLRCPLRGFSRNKSPAEGAPRAAPLPPLPQVPVLLLRDMDLCYRLLRRLVPGLPPGRAASRTEILQHVIDYILDLQTELDASGPGEPGDHTCQVNHSPETDDDEEFETRLNTKMADSAGH